MTDVSPMATPRVIQAALQSAVDDCVFPGAQLAVRLRGELQCVAVAGRLSSEPPGIPVQPSTIYDLASLTKPLATVTSVLLLIQAAKVALEDSVQQILGELEGTPIGQACQDGDRSMSGLTHEELSMGHLAWIGPSNNKSCN